MEKLLARLAQQLDAIDEASLMSLWSKYATTASRFEPTKRWEEATLIFSLIQAKRWKNQLFNYYWSQQSRPGAQDQLEAPESLAPDFGLEPAEAPAAGQTGGQRIQDGRPARRCRVLAFHPAPGDSSAEADDIPTAPEDSGKPGTDD